jgi:hypothetical protein
MKVTIELETGKTEVYDRVTDLYVAMRQEDYLMESGTRQLHPYPKVSSRSWGGNVRELVKEVQQSLVELQDFLRGQRNGGSS